MADGIDTQLPALFSFKKHDFHICEVLNLSMGGARIKTSKLPPPVGEDVYVHIALIGLRKEVEFCAKIVRHIVPNEENEYQHGFCVEITETSRTFVKELKNYMDNQSVVKN